MPLVEFICLANSDKLGGRCIAGIKTDGTGWVRLVSGKPDGTLYLDDYQLERSPQMFEVVAVECVRPQPKPYQPENWIVARTKWQFLGFPSRSLLNRLLKPELEQSATAPDLLGNGSDRLDYTWVKQHPAIASLTYVKPTNVAWMIQSEGDRRRYRARFTLNQQEYNLSITDPAWKAQIEAVQPPAGAYSAATLLNLAQPHLSVDHLRFTISLGEPFSPSRSEPYACFKVIAAVINTAVVSRQLA